MIIIYNLDNKFHQFRYDFSVYITNASQMLAIINKFITKMESLILFSFLGKHFNIGIYISQLI